MVSLILCFVGGSHIVPSLSCVILAVLEHIYVFDGYKSAKKSLWSSMRQDGYST